MRRILMIAGIFATVCACGLLLLFWGGHRPDTPASPQISDADIVSVTRARPLPTLSKGEESQGVDPEAFYQAIIDNNIFRRLNWQPPQRESAYTLLGTAVATDGSSATAYIQERKSGQFYAVVDSFLLTSLVSM